MDMTWVTERVALGGGIWNAQNMKEIVQAGVTHVLDMQIEFDDRPLAEPFGVRVLWNPTDDDFLPKPCREDELFESIRVLMGAVFDYEVSDTEEPAVRAPALSMKGLRRLSPESLANLHEATESGNKKALNQLIMEVRDAAVDTGLAHGLQDLADKYEYDVLLRLLEEAATSNV